MTRGFTFIEFSKTVAPFNRALGGQGFTLIELLVVVTIIVVLLALLTPALDKAIYQAEITVCGAGQKSIATGVTVYTASNQRKYPERKALQGGGQPTFLNNPWQGTEDRTVIMQYVPLDAYLDPLCDELDIDPSATQSKANSQNGTATPIPYVMSGYQLFYGWRYTDTPGQKGMMKVGDRFTWSGSTNLLNATPPPGGGAWGGTFDVLVSDQNSMSLTYGGAICSHPDEKGLLTLDTKRNEPYPSNTAVAGVNEGFYYVLSRWGMSNASERRGKEDINSARTDGSVSRMNGVAWDEEERVTSAPISTDGPGGYNYWLVLPK